MDHDNPLMMGKEEYEIARPNAGSLMQSLRAFGYDIATAIADLIDNSITARSDRISIQFEWNNGEPWIAVSDNGYGMTESELFEAMKTGSKNPLDYRDEKDLGRFGLGLKTASFSQCKRLTVASKAKSTPLNIRCWDLDLVTENNEWVLLKRVSFKTESLIKDIFRDRGSGTVVLWEKIDRIIPGNHINDDEYQDAFLSYAKAVKEHISVVFCSYMQGSRRIHFEINGMEIEMWDPFMMDNTLTTRMPVETLYVDGHEVTIRPFILPHQNKLTPDLFSKYAGKHGWNAQQGYYIFRNNRLIVAADWLIQGLEKLEQYRLARIRIDIGNETDSEWNIDVRKSTAVPPISITKEIKRIAIAARRESARIYRHRGKKLARKSKEEQSFVWHQNVRNGKLGYAINRNHPIVRSLLESDTKDQIKQLIDLIEETVPVPMIISDYGEKSKEMLEPYEGKKTDAFDDMISRLYEMYISTGVEPKSAIESIANTEPFIYSPERVTLFCEREGIDYE